MLRSLFAGETIKPALLAFFTRRHKEMRSEICDVACTNQGG